MRPYWARAGGLQAAVHTLRATKSVAADTPSRLHSASILLLEDDVELLTMFTRMLMATGYFVTASQLAEHAVAVLNSSRPVDLVIADLVLPGMGGHEFCHHAATMRPGLPFIVMTGSDTAIDLAQFPPNTSDIYKPFRRREVLELINTKLERGRTASLSPQEVCVVG